MTIPPYDYSLTSLVGHFRKSPYGVVIIAALTRAVCVNLCRRFADYLTADDIPVGWISDPGAQVPPLADRKVAPWLLKAKPGSRLDEVVWRIRQMPRQQVVVIDSQELLPAGGSVGLTRIPRTLLAAIKAIQVPATRLSLLRWEAATHRKLICIVVPYPTLWAMSDIGPPDLVPERELGRFAAAWIVAEEPEDPADHSR